MLEPAETHGFVLVDRKQEAIALLLPPGVLEGAGIEPVLLLFAIPLFLLRSQVPNWSGVVVPAKGTTGGVFVRDDQISFACEDGPADPLATRSVVVSPSELAERVAGLVVLCLEETGQQLDGILADKVAVTGAVGMCRKGMLFVEDEQNVQALFARATAFGQHAVLAGAVEGLGAVRDVLVELA